MFSYDEYKKILKIIKMSGRYKTSYFEALHSDSFILMRHDIEYSVKRAYDLAKVEIGMDFTSSYFFQWTNNSYNVLSQRNIDMLRDMHQMGHIIGLHFALNGLTDMALIKKQILKEIYILSEVLGVKISQFSIHRPSPDILRENIKFPGIINTYQDDFFTFAENVAGDTKLRIKYMSDANHIWRYGYPDETCILDHDRVQILAHPFAWTEEGHDNFHNYRTLIQEKYVELIDSIDRECKDFHEYRDNFIGKADGKEENVCVGY